MGKKKSSPAPSKAELEILQVLWRLGSSTARSIHEELNRNRSRATGYTTTLKLLQIMAEKGSVKRDASSRTHVYRTSQPQESMQRGLARDIMDRAFSGSARQLVLSALQAKRMSREELDEIRAVLDEHVPTDGHKGGERDV